MFLCGCNCWHSEGVMHTCRSFSATESPITRRVSKFCHSLDIILFWTDSSSRRRKYNLHQISCIIRLTGQGSECTTLKHTVPGKCVLNYFWWKLALSVLLLHPSERLECTRVPWLVHWELASSFQVGEMNSIQAWTLQEVNHLWLACYTEFTSQTWKLLQVDKECKCLCTADYLVVIIKFIIV